MTDEAVATLSSPAGYHAAAGEALSVADSFSITRRAPTIVVAPLGPQGCGKTTLITTMYDQFQLGPFAGHLFAGSESLIGLENRSFLSRTVSGETNARTERTEVGAGEQYLHLRLQEERQHERPRDVLIADMSGEIFEKLRDQPALAAQFPVIQAAHALAVFVDGELLASAKRHHSVLYDARMLLAAIVQEAPPNPHRIFQIVITKWDVLAKVGRAESEVRNEVLQVADGLLPRPASQPDLFVTAARPGGSAAPWAYGCAALLSSWMKLDSEQAAMDEQWQATADRFFDRFKAHTRT